MQLEGPRKCGNIYHNVVLHTEATNVGYYTVVAYSTILLMELEIALVVLVVSWLFQNFSHLFTSPVNNLATALLSMLLPFGTLYLMIFEQPPPLVLSEKGSKHTSTTKHTLLSLPQCILLSSVVRDPCYVPRHEF